MAKKTRFPKKCRVKINKDGSENICTKPLSIRTKISQPRTMREKMITMWKEFSDLNQHSTSIETIADSLDFDVDNDPLPSSPYESEGNMLDHLEAQQFEITEQPKENVNKNIDDNKGEKHGETTSEASSDEANKS
jgi:hypothetical protein